MDKLKKLKIRQIFFIVLTLSILLCALWYISMSPSNERDWSLDQAILPYVEIEGDMVRIFNIRDFRYQSATEYEVNYYDREYSLSDLSSVDYIVEPFGSIGAAHTFLSFGFENGDRLAVSVEIRKEKGESFSPVKGVFKQYELMYVLANERDVIDLRANHRDHKVYLYPVSVEREHIREMFVSILDKVNELKNEPEFYNTVTNNCATNIVQHINHVSPSKISWDIRLLLPEESDALFYELGLLDNSVPLEELRSRHLINEKASLYADDPDFSTRIRE